MLGSGNDTVNGGAGNDTIYVDGGANTINGGGGYNEVSYVGITLPTNATAATAGPIATRNISITKPWSAPGRSR